MTWARPDLLALLLLVPVVTALVVLGERGRRRVLRLIAAPDALASLIGPGVGRARVWQAVMAVIAAVGLALAAAGPRLGFEWQQQRMEGVSIVIVLDVSRSMDAKDGSTSRMEIARRKIRDFVGLMRGDAAGLVVFAAGPFVRIPLTVDYDTLLWALDDSSTDTIQAQGTALAGAVEAATGLLEKAQGSGKAIVVVSDGESHDEPAELDQALAHAKEAGVRVYALGVGAPEGAPIPLPEGGFKKDAQGAVVLSRLEEATLQKVAAATGGAYVRAVPSDEDVRGIYQGEIRGKLDAAERGMRREKLWHERFQWPLAFALGALAVASALGIGRRARRGAVAGSAAALFLLALSPPAHAGAAEDGRAALAAKDYGRAAELLGQARVQHPDDVGIGASLAEALYRAGRYREAEQLYDTLADQDAEHKGVFQYDAGNAAYRGGRLADALDRYRKAVGSDPELKAAQNNATAVEKEIAARTQQQQQQQQDSSNSDQDQQQQAQQDQQGQDQQQGQQGQQEGQQGQQQGQQGQQEGQQGQQQGQQGQQQGQQGQQDQQQGQQGEAQQGQQQQGQQQGQQPDQQAQGGSKDGQEPPASDGTRQAQPGEPGEQGDEQGQAAQAQDGQAQDGQDGQEVEVSGDGEEQSGAMTKAEAGRLVDSVREGRPRVVVGGQDAGKDW